jgi:hypothetical protein
MKRDQSSLTSIIDQLGNLSYVGDSYIGQLALGIIKKALSSYYEGNQGNGSLDIPVEKIRSLSIKWSKGIVRDLSKIEIDDTQKKIMLAVALASIYSNVISNLGSEESNTKE